MSDGPIYRSPSEVAEYLATHREARLGVGGRIIDGNSIRARLAQGTQDRLDMIIHTESELGVYDLESVREIGSSTLANATKTAR